MASATNQANRKKTEVTYYPEDESEQAQTTTGDGDGDGDSDVLRRKAAPTHHAPEVPPNRDPDSQPETAALQALNQAAILDPYRILPNKKSPNVEAFVRLVKDGLCERPHGFTYDPSRPRAKHVLDLGIYTNVSGRPRDFRIEEVSSYQVQRAEEDNEVTAFKVIVHDINESEGPSVQLYKLKPRAANPRRASSAAVPENCALDTSICRDEEAARQLGRIACRIMNRVPLPLPLSEWNAPTRGARALPHIVTFVEITSLMIWRHDIDLGLLHSDWIGEGESRDVYGSKIRSAAGTTTTLLQASIRFLCINTDLEKTRHTETVGVQLNAIRSDAILDDTALRIPDGFWFAEDALPLHGDGSRDFEAGWNIIRWSLYSRVGLCGTTEQLRDSFDETIGNYFDDLTLQRTSGSFNGGSFYLTAGPRSQHSYFSLEPSINVARILYANAESMISGEHMKTRTAASSALTCRFRTLERILAAHVQQQGLNALVAGKSLLNTILAMMEASDSIDRGEVSIEDVKQSHCSCRNASEKTHREHACMRCSLPFLCILLTLTRDNRLLCRACHTVESPTSPASRFPADTVIPDSQEEEDMMAIDIACTIPLPNDLHPSHSHSVESLHDKGVSDHSASKGKPLFPPDLNTTASGSAQGSSQSAPFDSTRPPTSTVDRQQLIQEATLARAVINPTELPEGDGEWAFLDPSQNSLDAWQAKKLGHSEAWPLALKRLEGDANISLDLPVVVFWPDAAFLNPREQPAGDGRWAYLTERDVKEAQVQYPYMTASELWTARFTGLAARHSRINIVWVKAALDTDSYDSLVELFTNRLDAGENRQTNTAMLEILESYLTKELPDEHTCVGKGHWDFLTDEDEALAEPNTAEQIWQQRLSSTGSDLVFLSRCNVVWIPDESENFESGIDPLEDKDLEISRLQERLAAFEGEQSRDVLVRQLRVELLEKDDRISGLIDAARAAQHLDTEMIDFSDDPQEQIRSLEGMVRDLRQENQRLQQQLDKDTVYEEEIRQAIKARDLAMGGYSN
ncbi:hypothetical protein M438DRAFT_355134 [Aureobasidium pullulans EXF-150]|uniref:Uncharacterized protein n=1 Tax=Aureobasidium pullulans EXF-150 TaxID=1043002 RepID=A0A074XT71_AURPU|nr:uncharacterized protein M438DRAFT_355134 [Aureobasidium pullulans EXF-150]KEQ85157.1 hypothetical protein M438DRAFT_355134 [Aureobasidium pullulans EXF-150]